jgi:hypothetical protein
VGGSLPAVTSPYADLVDTRGIEWADKHGLFPLEEQFVRIEEARLG